MTKVDETGCRTAKLALDFVIMNDDLCMHLSDVNDKDGNKLNLLSFFVPKVVLKNKKRTMKSFNETTDDQIDISILCPVCGHKYEEASTRLDKYINNSKMKLG